ncbi:glycerophosphodiester phosphodiesterase [Enterococcus sp.]|uniref:glycerophosphodiester phosphodiesterase n=1 Tax=Enterococcus sp. TaxID=35783 RepID=UPI002FCC09C3
MIEQLKQSMYQIHKNLKLYLESVFFLRMLRVLIALPLLSYLFLQILNVTGLSSITENTIFEVLRHPVALVVLLVLGLTSIFFIYYEQAYYFMLAHLQDTQEPYRLKTIIQKLNNKARYIINIQSVVFLIYFILILPIASIGMSPGLASNLYIPHFITDELLKFNGGWLIYFGVFALIIYLSLRLIFVVPYFVVEKEATILQAVKKSWQHTRKKSITNILYLGIIVGLYALAIGTLTGVLLIPLMIIERILPVAAPVVAGITLTFLQIVLFFSFGLLQGVFANVLYRLAYNRTGAPSAIKRDTKSFFFRPWSKILYPILAIVFISTVVGNTVSLTKILYQPTTQIIAHRGYMAEGVENTIGSLRAAKTAKADFVEMDIQQTKDQQFVVIHDANLGRLANRPERIQDLTLAQLQEIQVSAGGHTDFIPSFEDYLAVAKEIDMKLVVELKLHGDESDDMEEKFVEILQKADVTKEYIVQSLDESTVARVKELDPEIKTGYLVALNIGNLPKTSADMVVIEEFSLNQRLMEQARDQGKGIMVWTVNQENLVRRAFGLNVDGIITNEPSKAFAIRETFDQERTLAQRVQELLE